MERPGTAEDCVRPRGTAMPGCPRAPEPAEHSQLSQVLCAGQVVEAIQGPIPGASQSRGTVGAAGIRAGISQTSRLPDPAAQLCQPSCPRRPLRSIAAVPASLWPGSRLCARSCSCLASPDIPSRQERAEPQAPARPRPAPCLHPFHPFDAPNSVPSPGLLQNGWEVSAEAGIGEASPSLGASSSRRECPGKCACHLESWEEDIDWPEKGKGSPNSAEGVERAKTVPQREATGWRENPARKGASSPPGPVAGGAICSPQCATLRVPASVPDPGQSALAPGQDRADMDRLPDKSIDLFVKKLIDLLLAPPTREPPACGTEDPSAPGGRTPGKSRDLQHPGQQKAGPNPSHRASLCGCTSPSVSSWGEREGEGSLLAGDR
ncbi:hypothetical protein P7K49_037491 [Saguinus oedipus]|uniref:Uncharacterized protein n=1 Tax=Saguinus oedipus TaxID=9490 RepID=A0ABQ9TJ33_SAGOE|nr:hypothetical protein P7K49_037491 [Saguinus oedipus]